MLINNTYIIIKNKTRKFIFIIYIFTYLKLQFNLAFKVFYYITTYKRFQLYDFNKKIYLNINYTILLINRLFFKKIILKIKI